MSVPTTNTLCQRAGRLAVGLALWASLACQAHLMVAQHGTLNIVGDAAFMVVSLPVSALRGVDDDGDGRLSPAEASTHQANIENQVREGIFLTDARGLLPMQGLLISLSPPDDAPTAPAGQLVALARFAWGPEVSGPRLSMTLFGQEASTQTQRITVTQGKKSQLMSLSPDQPSALVLPPAWQVVALQGLAGASHILGGLDHLLFLLLVVVNGWGLRQVVLALSCFTAGHALTLAASSVWGGPVAASWVEPAIAATLVGLAVYDHWAAKQTQAPHMAWRVGLVFAGALVHGLGLAGGFNSLGLQGAGLVWSLLGFNLGIELAQIALVLAASAAWYGLRRVFPRACATVSQGPRRAWLGYVGITLGLVWLVQGLGM